MTDTKDVAYIRERLCNASDLMSEVFVRVEDMSKENTKLKELVKELRKALQKETPALGGDTEDMEHALYNINWLCDWALRPDEMKEMEKNNGI